MGSSQTKHTWWSDKQAGAWDRIKEAVRRDWEQTKQDLHLKGGHELNQNVGDTVKQASGKEPIPTNDAPNPPRVIGEWNDVELPHRYGYAARERYPQTAWTSDVETKLRADWETEKDLDPVRKDTRWDDVRSHVRRGFEYHD